MKTLLCLVFFLFYKTAAEDIIYRLDDEDFYRIPPRYHLDRFEPCVGLPNGTFCTVWADLVEDQPSELLHMIQAYSRDYMKHFNYSNIRYGLCLTKTCRGYYNGDGSTEAMWTASEACLNESINRDYDLKVRVTNIECYRHRDKFEKTTLDYAIVALLGVIVGLNIIGTIYDTMFRDSTKPGNEYLTAFSLRANWRRFVAPQSGAPNEVRLRCLNGIRTLSSFCVVFGHVPVLLVNSAINPQVHEGTYRDISQSFLHQGSAVVLTFYTMSGFLLVYSMELAAEKTKLNWKMLPKAVIARWLRLSPANLVVLMLTLICYKFIKMGPFLKEFIVWEAADCQKYWLYNVFFATNWIDTSQCNLQVWFVSSDMQLHILGLAVVLLTPRRARTLVLAWLYLLGLLYPACLIYTHGLEGIYLPTPSTINNYVISNAAFHKTFKSVFANLPSFTIGMAFGYVYYDMQKKNLLDKSYKKYRWVVRLAVVALIPLLMVGHAFYVDGPPPPLAARLLYQPFVKTVWTLLMLIIILGAVLKCDDVVTAILEWEGWVYLTRISYCTFLVHMTVLRYAAGTKTTLAHLSSYHLLQEFLGLKMMTVIAALLLHLLVEQPFAKVANLCLSRAKPTKIQANPKEVNGSLKDTNGSLKAD